MDREASPDPTPAPPVLGFLRYVDRKSGEVKQHYPIDAERITFGRDPDCDIRLHWDDVSRVHAEIQFDLLQGLATLAVLGSNGLYFLPGNQSRIKLDNGARQTLSTGDSFIIRKKLFIFEYPANDSSSTPALSPSILNTPVRGKGTPAKPPATGTPLRRRASHRLSLMPSDKPFVPLSPMKRRQSNAGQTERTPKKSHLSQAVQEDEEDEVMEGIVDVQQNEDGDMIILETREETPEVVEKPAMAPPKTPRSIPLPLPAQTPYVQTPPRVPSKVAMSTPPGPMTLHKALLLRSARKAWVESRPNDVDDAVADGKIEVARRKSKSPSKEEGGESKRKSLTPRPSVAQPDSDISDDEEEEAIAAGEVGLQWVHEDGMAEVSFAESDDDSLEADYSLDIPGQGVLDFRTAEVSPEDIEEDSFEEDEVHESFDSEKENRYESQQDEEEALNDEEEVQDEETEDLFEEPAAQSTPVQARILHRFYTPQVPRQQNQPRRSLASIGGPAVRAFGVPASPNPLGGGAFRLTPSKSLSTMPSSFEEEDEDEEEESYEDVKPIQSSVSDREIAEIKKRRQSLATPRRLPEAPMSFRDSIKGGFSLVKTPSHPALTRSPTKDEDEHDDTPIGDIRSRLDKMRRDSSARELSRPAGRDGRRATVGFVLPETPARPNIKPSASYTAARFGSVAPPTPGTPVVRPFDDEGDSVISSLHQTPIRSTAKKVGTPFSLIRRTPIQESAEMDEVDKAPTAEPVSPVRSKISTPDKRSGTSAQREQRPEPKTPYMGDIKSLYPVIPSPASPVLSGIKNLYPDLPLPPKTPDMRGMKGLFAGRNAVQATPGMEGMEEMFASPVRAGWVETAEEGRVEVEVQETVRDSPRRSRRSSVAPRAVEKALEAEDMVEEAQVVDDKPIADVQPQSLIRQLPPSPPQQQAVASPEPVPAKSTPSTRAPRAIKTFESTTLSTKSAPARTRAAPANPPVEVEKPSTSTRRRAAAPVAAPAPADTRSKPSRRAPAAVPEPTQVQEAAAPNKPTRSRAVSAKAPARVVSAGPSTTRPVSPEVKSAPAPRGRPKKVLAEADEQVPLEASKPTGAVSKPTRSRTATTAAPVPVPVAVAEKKSVSAPTRRTRAVKEDTEGEKENVAQEESRSAPVRASKARGAKKEVVAAVEPVVSTSRATRSRK